MKEALYGFYVSKINAAKSCFFNFKTFKAVQEHRIYFSEGDHTLYKFSRILVRFCYNCQRDAKKMSEIIFIGGGGGPKDQHDYSAF